IAEDLPAPPGNQPLHARGEGVRNGDLDRVDRLQEDRLAFRQRLLDRLAAGRLERHVGAVDGVELAGQETDREIDDREAERSVAGCPTTARLWRLRNRSSAICKCTSPWPHNTISRNSAFCSSWREGSSSISLPIEPVSLTSSPRFSAWIARP